jgi:hypothetical protein
MERVGIDFYIFVVGSETTYEITGTKQHTQMSFPVVALYISQKDAKGLRTDCWFMGYLALYQL